MRVKLEGESNIDRIIDALKMLELNAPRWCGREELTWHNVNIYLTFKDQGETVQAMGERDGERYPIEGIALKDPAKEQKQAAAKTAKLAAKRPKLRLVG